MPFSIGEDKLKYVFGRAYSHELVGCLFLSVLYDFISIMSYCFEMRSNSMITTMPSLFFLFFKVQSSQSIKWSQIFMNSDRTGEIINRID